ncbi:MAG: hypothetical protein E6K10_07750 [Methanobacteriota archaeon]|nr:MAG: hypothetical protein E6K10_07750 [Euryarchaeota archaeon]
MKTFGIVATALVAVLVAGTAAAVSLPHAAIDHMSDTAAANFPNPETGSQGKDVSGHPSAGTNGVPPGPPTWLNESAPYGPPTWLGGDGGPPDWVQSP